MHSSGGRNWGRRGDGGDGGSDGGDDGNSCAMAAMAVVDGVDGGVCSLLAGQCDAIAPGAMTAAMAVVMMATAGDGEHQHGL